MKIGDITKEKIHEAVKSFVDLGTIREAKGITHAEMESIYAIGLGFYRTGNYTDAEKVFKFLCLFDHVNSRYWTALGGVRQARREFAAAAEAYKFAMFLDITNVKALYYLAQCFAALGQTEDALGVLDEVEKLDAKGEKLDRPVVAKARALKEQLEKKEA